MAKIQPANVAPDALPRVRGVVLTRISRGVIIAQKWPTKRGPSQTREQIFLTKQFSIAAQYAANAEPMSAETARYFSQGTVWLPRDLLVRAAYGNLFEIFLPDGSKAYQTSHACPPPPNPPRPRIMQWQPNCVAGINAATPSTSAFAFKGAAFIPDVSMDMVAVQTLFAPVNGATYVAVLCEMNGSNVITAITTGTPRTLSGTVKKIYEFSLQANLPAGTRIALMVGRTSGTATYAMPMVGPTGTNFTMPVQELGFARIAQTAPAVGQTVDVGAGSFFLNPLIEF